MSYSYQGGELEIFARAVNWKRYLKKQIELYIEGDVLEVGSGLSTNTRLLFNSSINSWTALEPDLSLVDDIDKNWLDREPKIQILNGFLKDQSWSNKFDTILYLDVLEHIQNDIFEIDMAFAALKPGGNVVVVSPAHNYLFSEFDRSVGHYRRYSKQSIQKTKPKGAEIVRLDYLDCAGLIASVANKLVLHQRNPSLHQIMIWDNILVKISQWLDRVLRYRIGKSIIFIFKKPNP